jgi:hypothetical protein
MTGRIRYQFPTIVTSPTRKVVCSYVYSSEHGLPFSPGTPEFVFIDTSELGSPLKQGKGKLHVQLISLRCPARNHELAKPSVTYIPSSDKLYLSNLSCLKKAF